jgi:hypothetical protein
MTSDVQRLKSAETQSCSRPPSTCPATLERRPFIAIGFGECPGDIGDKGADAGTIRDAYLTAVQLPSIISMSMTVQGQSARPTGLIPVTVLSLRRLTLALHLLLSTLLLNLRGLLLLSHPAAG